ncbi:MAG: TraR/DksA family transcriptional regulator [Saprospiraceae bacterium]|nr:TraR/DksA family transcriptional regulator [Saprospiraceae bacterium]
MTSTVTYSKERYNDADLAEFRQIIEKKLLKAKDDYIFYMTQLTDLTESGDTKLNKLDDAVGSLEMEYIASSAARVQKHINHLEEALMRIKNRVYGVCRITGKLIPRERLRIVPHATLCVEAKS